MSAIRTKIFRKSKHRSVSDSILRQLRNAIADGGNLVRNTAVESIQSHGSSGRVYEKYNPRRTHTASTEGNPPNTDTGFLVNNIHLVFDADRLGCSIESRAAYSEALEFGTSKMGARPFLQPALEQNKGKIKRKVRNIRARGR
tara:strand:- start:236 stop:664 length:429 start_codon:yes stop_codon:yes gene_type:complete